MCSSKKAGIFLISIFAVSVIIRFMMADFSKSILIYYDELRYFSIADSIASGSGMQIYNVDSGFQKILYSLVISPAFLFSDRSVTIKLVMLINSVIASSGVFPVWMIAKKMLRKTVWRVGSALMYLFMADMIYTMTFMSESLFIPMALWIIWIFVARFIDDKKGAIRGIFLGGVIYLAYLCKEISLTFLIVYFLMDLAEAIKGSFGSSKRENVCACVLDSVPIIVSFVILHVLFKLTVFRGLGNSYDQTSISVLLGEGRLEYLFYGFFYFLCSCIVSVYFLPVIIPIANWGMLSETKKKFYQILVLLVVVNAAVVAYTITVREDFGTVYQMTPRAHLRYISFVTVPLFISYFSTVEIAPENDGNKRNRNLGNRMFGMSFVFAVGIVIIAIWKGICDESGVDQMNLCILEDAEETEIKIIVLIAMIASIFIVWFYDRVKVKRLSAIVLFGTVICTQLVSASWKYESLKNLYKVWKKDNKAAQQVVDIIEENNDAEYLYLADGVTVTRRISDTYFESQNMCVVEYNCLQGLQGMELSEVAGIPTAYSYSEEMYHPDEVDFVIVESAIEKYVDVERTNAELVLSNKNYLVYEVFDESRYRLPYFRSSDDISEGENVFSLESRVWPFLSEFEEKYDEWISSDAGWLVYGPYFLLPAGKYEIEFYVSCENAGDKDRKIGYVDINGESSDIDFDAYKKEIMAGEQKITIENIEIESDLENFEARIYADEAGVSVEKIVINKIE